MSAVLAFALPSIADNGVGWGPLAEPVASGKDMPFHPFAKSEHLGRISDWQGTGKITRAPRTQSTASAASAFAYKHEEDESSFSIVDNTKSKQFGRKQKWTGGGGQNRGPRPFVQQHGHQNRQNFQQNRWGGRQFGRGGRGYQPRFHKQQAEVKEQSVDIQPDWNLVEDFAFSELTDLQAVPSEIETLVEAGTLAQYELKNERCSARAPLPLQRFDRQHFTATTSSDPVIQRLIKQQEGNVFATDTLLALLMAAPRSVLGWDIIITKKNGVLVLDKRPSSRVDFVTVNENMSDSPNTDKDGVNSPVQLANEATFINHNFSQQMMMTTTKAEPIAYDEPNPFLSAVNKGSEPASVGYRYRKFTMGDNGSIKVVARCSVDAYCVKAEEQKLLTIKALNEYDCKVAGTVDWRQKLDSQPSAVLVHEMKNNANKLARWTAEAVMAGADEMKIGFVSRANSKEPSKHQILAVKSYQPLTFANQINLKLRNMWGVLQYVIESVQALDDGKYILIRDANSATLHLYSGAV